MPEFKNGDRYAGISTVMAVIIAVEYNNDPYDIWDFAIGVLGIVLALKYKNDINGEDRLITALTSVLLSLSIVICLYSYVWMVNIEPPFWLNYHLKPWTLLPHKFLMVLMFSAISFVWLHRCAISKLSTHEENKKSPQIDFVKK